MKVLGLVVAAVFAFATLAPAQMINTSVIHTDARGLWIGNTFTVSEGGRVKDYIYTTSKNDTLITINPVSPTPGYLILTVPAEAALTRIALQFCEPVASNEIPLAYTLGDTIFMYIGGLYRQEVFNVGLWDYVKVWPVGSAGGKCDLYWRVECYGN